MIGTEATPLGLLLRRARLWQQAGKEHQAIAGYLRLVEYFPGSYEAQTAREELLSLAQHLEAEGSEYQATHLYYRLASLE